ncbi:phage tail tape measure protein [Pontibacillus yanchengensis]|uniref:Phage tail tape measure protein n=1 Tax=Pontibacillus yanchengensis TaxID=462910 RepID=A0ACC7VEC9_9BACI|nr:phage tail tape measure protein [Pontibacillus yanchengensis]MYL53318.1 phage tail tape measure protein [Pontibacillus yanchengensis]
MSYDLTAKLQLQDRLSRPLKKATDQVKRTQRQTEGLSGRMKALDSGMKNLAVGGVAALSTGLIAMTGYAAKVGMTFEAEMDKVKAVTGATTAEMAAMTEQAKELGKQTQFSATQAAQAQAFLAQSGMDTKEVMGSMPSVLDLAASGQLDLAQASDLASNVLSGFNMEASEMGHVSDVLAKSAASANTSVGQMGEALSYSAPIAQGLGISLEETASAIGLFSNAGIQGSRAGSSLRGMLSQLQSATGSTADKLKELGLSAKDVNPAVHSLSDIVKTLKDSGATAADAMKLVGQEAGPGLAALLTQGSGKLDEMTEKFKNADGAASKMADTMNDNLRGRLRELKSAFDGLALDIFDQMKPGLNSLAKDAKDFVGVLTAGFAILSGQDVKGVKQLTEVFGAADGGTEKVVRWSNAFETAKQKFNTAKDALTDVYNQSKKVANWIINNWPLVSNIIVGVATAATTLRVSFAALSIIRTIKNSMLLYQAAAFATTAAQHGLNAAMRANPIGAVITALTLLVTAGVLLYKNWGKITEKAGQLWSGIQTAFGQVGSFVEGVFYRAKSAVVSSINTIIEKINGMIGKINSIPGVNVPIVPKVSAPQIPDSVAQSQGLSPMAARGVQVDGSHKAGLERVPYDGYVARLHKGERVQTAEEAKEDRNGGEGGNTYNFNVNYTGRGNTKQDAEELLYEMSKIIERKGARMASI